MSTATYKQLKQLGVCSKGHAAEIIPYLCDRLGESPQKCENMVCELLRRKYGRDNTKDYFVRGHELIVIQNKVICRVDGVGRKEKLCYITATYNDCYMPNVVWWKDSEVSFGGGPHEWDNTVVSLKKRKLERLLKVYDINKNVKTLNFDPLCCCGRTTNWYLRSGVRLKT